MIASVHSGKNLTAFAQHYSKSSSPARGLIEFMVVIVFVGARGPFQRKMILDNFSWLM